MGSVNEGGATGSVQPGGPGDRILFWPQVKGIVPFSRSTVWRMQRIGAFPLSVQVSKGRVGWWESELSAWKRARTPHCLPEARPFVPPPDRSIDHGGSGTGRPPSPLTVQSLGPATDPRDAAAPPGRLRRGRRRPEAVDQIAFDFGA
jgi:prophage regulatory protein